ncbi:MAG TPA: XdhC family protein, partial [Gemmatimonadales bacterium]|nr:XdhC family protein [Gemmatimonadales bacterium]
MNVWKAAADLIRAGESGALATVARVRGSTPVPAGTKMLVGAEGRLIGSVGGGCVEADVIGAALAAQRDRQPQLVTHHLNADLAGDLGLSCGGTVDIFVEPLLADERYVRVLDQAATADSGLVRTATTWKDYPVKTFEQLAPGDNGVAASLTRDGRFIEERLSLAPRVFVFGAGHVGAAIARAAAAAGFRVIVIDDRVEYADPSRFPAGTGVVMGDVAATLE